MIRFHAKTTLREPLLILAICLILFATSTGICQETQTANNQQVARPLHMLVLGDSILWGQGLKAENKPFYHVKLWLEKSTGRRVVERIEAHSGAVIQRTPHLDARTSSNPEVNLGLPTINDELDNALRFYPDASLVDLVLVSGCANDVGVRNFLNASKTGEVDDMAEAKCGTPVENLLRLITTAFPAAHVVMTGYYPFFSEETRHDFVVKALARRFFETHAANGNSRMSSREVFERLKLNSKRWHEVSNIRLGEAARRINSEIGHERVLFAKIEFPARYSFAAPETRLWGFNRSPFRMALLFLSFGKVLLPSNDEVRKQRSASCNEIHKQQANETDQQKKDRKAQRLLCRYAALGHPNRTGALLYADAITKALNSTMLVTASRSQ